MRRFISSSLLLSKKLVIYFLLVLFIFSSLLSNSQTVTYYFNSYGSETWDGGEANIVDGNTGTNGYDNNNGHYINLTGNTCPGTDLGTISKVEIRAYFENNYDANSNRTIAPRLIPFFSGTAQGDDYDYPNGNYDGSAGYPAWGAYFDITNGTNAPVSWTWTDVQNLDCRLVSNRPNSGQHRVYRIDIRVTYGTCNTSSHTWTGAVNTNWNNAGNWYGGSTPTTTSDVIIPATCVTNWPTLNVDANCKNLTIEAGAILNCSSYNLNVYGNWTNSGVFNKGTGSVYFKGSNNVDLKINGSSQTILSESFETGTTDWTLGSLTGHAEWRRQSGAANTGTWDCAIYDIGNSAAHDFPRTGNNAYVDLSRTIDLSDYSSASITYYWRSDGDDASHPLFNFAGTILDDNMKNGGSSWHSETFNLSSFCGDYDNYMFFRMWVGDAVGGGAPGLCIDDITITGTFNVQEFNNIYIEKTGGATVRLLSSIKADNNLQISSGTFNANGYNITIAGNFTNNGTFNSGSGIAKFNGTSTQNITGTSNTSFYDFIKDSPNDLILDGSSNTITIANSFSWIDNDDKITVDGTAMSLIINDGILVNMGCELEINGGSTISIAENFQNLGTIDFTTGNSILKFHSSRNSYVLTEPGDTIFSDDFETDPFAGSSNWNITNPGGRSEFRWSNGQQHSGANDLAVWDNMDGGYPYDYQWDSGTDSSLAEIDIDLTNYTGGILEFWWKCGGDDPAQAGYDGDYGQVFINDVAITNELWGQQTYIKHNPISLADYAGSIITLKFKFRQDGQWSGGHASSPGFCIDDILIYANSIETLEVYDLLVEKDNNTTSTVIICPVDAKNDITITQGILDASGNNISIEGNWASTIGTIFLPRNDTVIFDGNNNKTVDIGNTSFDNLFINKPSASLSISNNLLDVDKKLYIYSNSTLKSSGQNIELGGDWQNSGTFTHDNNTVTFDDDSDIQSGGTSAGQRFYNVELDGTTATLQNDIWIENNFTITGGTWDVSASNRTMTVFGNWYCEGAFTQRNGNVNLQGNNTTIYFNSGNSTVPSNAFEDDFETDKGWTLTGEFERAAPNSLGGEHGNPDPNSAVSGTNILGVDLTGLGTYPGDYENSLSDRAYTAISPSIDCSNHTNCHIEFERWLGVESSTYDHAYIDISTNGGGVWTNIWTSSATIAENSWGTQDIDISAYADGESNVQIRYAMGSSDGSWQYCGWNIDDFRLYGDEAVILFGEYYDLTINKSTIANNVACLSSFNVNHNLTFNQGKIDLRDKTIDLETTGTLVNETNDNRIFASDGSGSEGTGTGTIIATRTNPSGNIANLGCEISPSSAMGVTTITRGHIMHANVDGSGHASILRYFDISPTNNSGLNATLKFHYFEDELNAQPELDLEMWRSTNSGTSWTNRNGIPTPVSDFVQLTGIDAFSWWTLSGKEFPLPIELLDFNGNCNNNFTEIAWKTASEKNNDYFTIEKSIDGVNFEDLGDIEGKGNSNQVEDYYYEDFNYKNGITYYRLKQTDFDGNFTVSNVIKIDCSNTSNTQKDLSIYPNPAKKGDNLFIEVTGFDKEDEVLVVVYDIYGRTLYSKVILEFESKSTVIASDQLNRLPSGTYIIIGTSKNEVYRKKLIIN